MGPHDRRELQGMVIAIVSRTFSVGVSVRDFVHVLIVLVFTLYLALLLHAMFSVLIYSSFPFLAAVMCCSKAYTYF